MNLPASMSEADLAAWIHKMWAFDDRIMPEDTEMARAVIALVEAKCREAVDMDRGDASASCECDSTGLGQAYIDWIHSEAEIVSRILSTPASGGGA